MKSKQITFIKKISKGYLFKLFLLDLIFVLFYKYYQPLCEPCLICTDCPPCLSKQQYFILYFGLALNSVIGLYCLYKYSKMKK
jgi:hypothetical protein